MIKSVLVTLSLTTFVLSNAFAQSGTGGEVYQTPDNTQQASPLSPTRPITRAEVRHELEELEAAGYNPAEGDDNAYPADLLAAQAKVAAKHRAEHDRARHVLAPTPGTKPVVRPITRSRR
jgi:Domain of unknown function (DUF4148)